MEKTLLQINVTANWGSTGRIAEGIGIAAMAKGWNSYIAYGRYCNPSKSKLIKIGNKWNPYINYIEQRIFDNEGLGARMATRKLVQQIDEIKPDIVQLHNMHDHYVNYKILFEYLNKKNIPVVWTFHDCWAFTGHCFHFVTKKCNRWKKGCYDCPLHHCSPNTMLDCSKKHWNLKKKLFQGCKKLTIACCSQWMADFVNDSFLKDKRIEVFRNGIDLKVFKPSVGSATLASKYRVLAVASVWDKDKGLNDIPKLRNLLSEDFEIVLVGLKQKQLKNLPIGVRGIQHTQNIQEMVELYSSANVFINPTYADTFPTVNLEALASGTPVVTYRTGGSPEAVDEHTGIVVEQGNVEAMASAVETICNKGKAAYTDACRQRAVEHFNKDERFEDYITLYDSLL